MILMLQERATDISCRVHLSSTTTGSHAISTAPLSKTRLLSRSSIIQIRRNASSAISRYKFSRAGTVSLSWTPSLSTHHRVSGFVWRESRTGSARRLSAHSFAMITGRRVLGVSSWFPVSSLRTTRLVTVCPTVVSRLIVFTESV